MCIKTIGILCYANNCRALRCERTLVHHIEYNFTDDQDCDIVVLHVGGGKANTGISHYLVKRTMENNGSLFEGRTDSTELGYELARYRYQ